MLIVTANISIKLSVISSFILLCCTDFFLLHFLFKSPSTFNVGNVVWLFFFFWYWILLKLGKSASSHLCSMLCQTILWMLVFTAQTSKHLSRIRTKCLNDFVYMLITWVKTANMKSSPPNILKPMFILCVIVKCSSDDIILHFMENSCNLIWAVWIYM